MRFLSAGSIAQYDKGITLIVAEYVVEGISSHLCLYCFHVAQDGRSSASSFIVRDLTKGSGTFYISRPCNGVTGSDSREKVSNSLIHVLCTCMYSMYVCMYVCMYVGGCVQHCDYTK